ncbi:MAG: transcription termination/antitermination NusG family protein, partial [Bryobacteraceae bacterium]
MADDRPEEELESPATPDAPGELDTEREVEDTPESDPLEEDQGVAVEEIHPESGDGVHSEAPVPSETDKHWYIIHAYSGFEQKVAESLRTRSQAFGFADRLGQILIPTEEVIELRNGKKVTSKRLLYPGYVLVEMEMDDELWHAVKSTPRVTGFVGGGTKPVPLTADEVNSVLYRQA